MIIDTIKDLFKFLFSDKRMNVIITYFLVFYGATASPELPNFILKLFENQIFRIFVLSLIVYKANSNPTLSILVALSFVIVMGMVNKKKFSEEFKSNFKEYFADENDEEEKKRIEAERAANRITVAQNWKKPEYAHFLEAFPGINSICVNNLPEHTWTQSCVPIYINDDGQPEVDPNCKESELSKAMNLPASKKMYVKKAEGKYSKKELNRWDPITEGEDAGNCIYHYKQRQYDIGQCTAEGEARCGNDTFPEDYQKEFTYCTNPFKNQGTAASSCAFFKEDEVKED